MTGFTQDTAEAFNSAPVGGGLAPTDKPPDDASLKCAAQCVTRSRYSGYGSCEVLLRFYFCRSNKHPPRRFTRPADFYYVSTACRCTCWAPGRTRKTRSLSFRSIFLVEGEDTEPTKTDSEGAKG